MKRISFAMGLVAATMFAAPLAAQTRNDGPWWDPSNTGSRGSTDTRNETVYDRNGRVYDRNGRVYDRNETVYDNSRADGQWHRTNSRDSNGNIIYVRTRRDSNGNVIQERARRNALGQYRVLDRRVISNVNDRRGRRGNAAERHREHDERVHGVYDGRDRNDRWEQNGGHDNGRHNGKYKNKKNKNKNRRD